MHQPDITFHNVYLSDGAMGYHTIRIPAIVPTTAGTLLAFAEGRVHRVSDHGEIRMLVRRSVDHGRTWGPLHTIWAEAGDVTFGNPVPLTDPETGRVHLVMTRNNHAVFHTYSDDDGISFATPRNITDVFEPLRPLIPWVRVATGPGHGIALSGGRLVVPWWLNDRPINQTKKATFRAGAMFSDDHGSTWKAGQPVPPRRIDLNENSIFECADGSLCMNLRTQHALHRCVARSDDGGRTWSEPVFDFALPDPTCQGPTLVVTTRSGQRVTLFAVPHSSIPHNDRGVGKRERLTIHASLDDGRTWPYARQIVHEGLSGYSDLAWDGLENLYLFYEAGVNRVYERLVLATLPVESILNHPVALLER